MCILVWLQVQVHTVVKIYIIFPETILYSDH